jgi:hypothetical protein
VETQINLKYLFVFIFLIIGSVVNLFMNFQIVNLFLFCKHAREDEMSWACSMHVQVEKNMNKF